MLTRKEYNKPKNKRKRWIVKNQVETFLILIGIASVLLVVSIVGLQKTKDLRDAEAQRAVYLQYKKVMKEADKPIEVEKWTHKERFYY